MKTYVISNDWQIPFEDKPVVELMFKFIEAIKPDGIILNGDIVDCFSLSTHRKDAKELSKANLQKDISHLHRYLERLEKIPLKWYLEGNHENRLYNYMQDHAGELAVAEGMDFPTIFGLGEHGFKHKEWGDYVMLGKLMVTHGDIVRKHSAYTAKAHFDKFGTSVLHGHTHRIGWYCHTNIAGAHGAWENGCMCRLDGLGYTHNPDWQQGFSVVHVWEGGMFNVSQNIILGRKLFFYGSEVWRRD